MQPLVKRLVGKSSTAVPTGKESSTAVPIAQKPSLICLFLCIYGTRLSASSLESDTARSFIL